MKKQIKHYVGGREGIYDPRYDAYEGGTLPGITVTGNAPKKGLYPVRLRFNPNKWTTARTKLLLPSEMMAPLSLAAEAINEVPVIGPAFNQYVAPALSVGNWIVGGGNPYEGMELRANDERLLGGWLPLDFAGPKIVGSAVSKVARELVRMNPKIDIPAEPRNVINNSLTTANVSHTTNPRQYVSPQSSLWMDAQTLEPTMTTDWSARDLFRLDRINSLYTPEEIASNRRFFARMSDETTIPKGFVEGNEQGMPTSAMVPVEETGLSVRNANPINLENPVMNPAERQAALDFLKENPQMRGLIETKVRPGVAEEDWRYPHETMVEHGLRKPTVTTNKYTKAKKLQQEDLTKDLSRSYGPSQQIGFSENWDFSMDRTRFERLQKAKGEVTENVELEPPKPVKPPKVEPPKKTSQQRSKEYYREKVEDKEQGVFKRQRRLFNLAHALEDGDMRHANSGRPNRRQIANAELNIEKYPLYEQKNYEKLRKRLARRGYTTEEISRSPEMKDLLEDLIRRYGNY